MRNGFFRIGMAALVLICCMSVVRLDVQASKVEEAPMETALQETVREILVDTLNIPSVFPNGVPVVTLSFDSEGETVFFNAVVVQDEQQNPWLISVAEAGAYATKGTRADVSGEVFSGSAEYLGTSGLTAVFAAPDGNTIPSGRIGNAGKYIQVLNLDSVRSATLSEPMSMADFEKYEGYYLLPYSSHTGFSEGSPVLCCETGWVCGLISKTDSGAMMIIDLSEITFPEKTVDTTAQYHEESEQKQETAEEKPEGIALYIGIGILVVVLVALVGICMKKRDSVEKVTEDVPQKIAPEPEKKTESNATVVCKPWQIRCIRGARMGEAFALQNSLVIGRDGADVVFPEGTAGVSRKHCSVTTVGHRVFLQDLNSTYGTYVGEGAVKQLQPEAKEELQFGDVFTLSQGGPMFRLEHPGEIIGYGVRSVAGNSYRPDACGVITFGRNSTCTVCFERDRTVISTNHCKLFTEEKTLYLMDLGSTNGTFLQDHSRLLPHKKYPVTCGTSFYLSDTSHRFIITEG